MRKLPLLLMCCALALGSCASSRSTDLPGAPPANQGDTEDAPVDAGSTNSKSSDESGGERPVLADSFFSGYAYVDANGNGRLDEDDPPLAGALFTAVDARGYSGGGYTNSDGWAMAWWPSDSEYPVTVRMQPPADSGYVVIGDEEIVLPAYESSARFLFAPEEQ